MPRRVLHHLRRAIASPFYRLCGTHLYSRAWRERKKPINLFDCEALEQDRHRAYLIDHIATFAPFGSVLDVGCGAGPAVTLLAKRFPESSVLGIDIHPLSVEQGNRRLAELGLGNASLSCGDASDLSRFRDKSIDVVYTDAVLLYIGRDAIRDTIGEMVRVARKGLLFFEFHDPKLTGDSGIRGVHREDGFIRNYDLLLRAFPGIGDVSIKKIPTEVFPTGRWPLYAHAIRVAIGGAGSATGL